MIEEQIRRAAARDPSAPPDSNAPRRIWLADATKETFKALKREFGGGPRCVRIRGRKTFALGSSALGPCGAAVIAIPLRSLVERLVFAGDFRAARPMEAALIAWDSLIVVEDAALAGQLNALLRELFGHPRPEGIFAGDPPMARVLSLDGKPATQEPLPLVLPAGLGRILDDQLPAGNKTIKSGRSAAAGRSGLREAGMKRCPRGWSSNGFPRPDGAALCTAIC